MKFLHKVRPHVDFARKQVAVVHKNIHYKLPSCVVSSSGKTSGELVCVKGSEQPGAQKTCALVDQPTRSGGSTNAEADKSLQNDLSAKRSSAFYSRSCGERGCVANSHVGQPLHQHVSKNSNILVENRDRGANNAL